MCSSIFEAMGRDHASHGGELAAKNEKGGCSCALFSFL
jgi:hypothetical protein